MNYKEKINLLEFLAFQKKILRKYKTYLHNKMHQNYKKAAIFVYWLNDYIEYIKAENTFNPRQNIIYKRGQIVYVNFGYRIGRELGGAHYAIVLDVKNSASASTVTVIPLKSYKGKETSYSKIYTVSLTSDIKNRLFTKGEAIKESNFQNLLKLSQKLSENPNLANDRAFKSAGLQIKRRDKLADSILTYAEKLKNGSIADVGQITTISKQRIIQPCKPDDVLTGLRISDDDFQLIEEKIRFLFLKP